MIRQLIISGVEMDIADVEITRTYRTPFFTNVEQLRNDHTYTVNLPFTPKNMAVFGYANREDMFTTKPYDFLYADYYVDGLVIFRNAECRLLGVSDTFEVEFVYGINRQKYLPLFSRKINEIRPNGTTILEDDWIVEWNPVTGGMSYAGKFKYLNYFSGERESDFITNGTDIYTVTPPEPFASYLKEMTQHPFILFNDIIDLIIADHNANTSNIDISTDIFDDIKDRLTNKGIILGGNKGEIDFSFEQLYLAGDYLNQNDIMYLSIYQSTFATIPSIDVFYRSVAVLGAEKYPIQINFDLSLTSNDPDTVLPIQISLYKQIGADITKVVDIPYVSNTDAVTTYNTTYSLEAEAGAAYFFRIKCLDPLFGQAAITGNRKITFTHSIKNALFSMLPTYSYSEVTGYYDCLMNLPDMTAMEFLQQMLIMTGQGFTYNQTGDLAISSPDIISNYLGLGVSTNWSGRISNVRSGVFNFNSNAQRNWFKFNNSDDVLHESKGYIDVYDNTLDSEKDLYSLNFDIAERNNGIAELILYKQRVTESEKSGDVLKSFSNEYQSKESAVVYDSSGNAIVEFVKPNDISVIETLRVGFINSYYQTYRKLIERPIIKEIEINLGFFESANIDFQKPIYVQEWGKYAVLLELTAPDNEVCTAKLLLINQKL